MPVVVPLESCHWSAVQSIYRAGIATGHATFETRPPAWEAFDAGHLADHRLVAVDDGGVVGWVAVSATSTRPVYGGVVEHSLYVASRAQGCGVGRLLLRALIESTEAAGIWTIQSGVFPENASSLALHRSCGFQTVGTRRRIGRMTHGPLAGQWRDTVLLERRSEVAGRD